MNRRKLVTIALVIGALLGVSAFFWRQAVRESLSKTVQDANAGQLFCQGMDPLDQNFKMVRFLKSGTDRGEVAVFKKGIHATSWSLQTRDSQSYLAYGQGESEKPNRLSMKADAKKRLQVYRECAPTPVCRFEILEDLNSEKMQVNNQAINQAQRQSLEARKLASIQIENFNKAKQRALLATVQSEVALAKKHFQTTKNFDYHSQLTEVSQHPAFKAGIVALKNPRDIDLENQYKAQFAENTDLYRPLSVLSIAESSKIARAAKEKAKESFSQFDKMSIQSEQVYKNQVALQNQIEDSLPKPKVVDLSPLATESWCN